MFVDTIRRFVYLAVPKTGSSSIHKYFGYDRGHPEPAEHHMGVRRFCQEFPQFATMFKFAFVRNPWDKLWSTYADFTMRRGHQYSEKVRHDKPLLSEFADFKDFCLRLKDSSWIDDIFFVPQTELVTTEDGKEIDFIGRFERLANHMYVIETHLGLPHCPLPFKNGGLYSGGYRSAYTRETRKAIGDLYAEDIERFGYEF